MRNQVTFCPNCRRPIFLQMPIGFWLTAACDCPATTGVSRRSGASSSATRGGSRHHRIRGRSLRRRTTGGVCARRWMPSSLMHIASAMRSTSASSPASVTNRSLRLPRCALRRSASSHARASCNTAVTTIHIGTRPLWRRAHRPSSACLTQAPPKAVWCRPLLAPPAHEAYHDANRSGGKRWRQMRRASTILSPAPVPPAAPSPLGSVSRDATGCCCWKPAARTAIPGSTSRWASPRSTPIRASTGCTRASRRSSLAGAGCTSRAARCSAAPARSTAWCICEGMPRTTTNGGSAAAPAGTGTACCPTSRRPNIRSAAPTSSTAYWRAAACVRSAVSLGTRGPGGGGGDPGGAAGNRGLQ